MIGDASFRQMVAKVAADLGCQAIDRNIDRNLLQIPLAGSLIHIATHIPESVSVVMDWHVAPPPHIAKLFSKLQSEETRNKLQSWSASTQFVIYNLKKHFSIFI